MTKKKPKYTLLRSLHVLSMHILKNKVAESTIGNGSYNFEHMHSDLFMLKNEYKLELPPLIEEEKIYSIKAKVTTFDSLISLHMSSGFCSVARMSRGFKASFGYIISVIDNAGSVITCREGFDDLVRLLRQEKVFERMLLHMEKELFKIHT